METAKANGEDERAIEILEAYADSLRATQTQMVAGIAMTSQVASEVFWNIANEAAISGNSFVDLEGKALGSAQAIYNFLSSGDASFNSFVQQAARITGLSVQDIMNAVNGMLSQTQSNAAQVLNNIIGMVKQAGYATGAMGSMLAAATAGGLPSTMTSVGSLNLLNPAPVGQQYPGGLGSGGGGGGGGGNKADEKQKKIDDSIEKARKAAIDSLKRQLDLYKDIIDARKEILDTMSAERKYQQNLEEQQANILKIQNELAALSFDDSAEADARRLELELELADAQKELENTQYDKSIEDQKAALDAEYEAFAKRVDDAIYSIENIQASSLSGFAAQLAVILAGITPASVVKSGTPQGEKTPPLQTLHEGGLVGGESGKLKSNEVFAKLMKGEMVVSSGQMSNFMNKTLPSLMKPPASTMSDVKFDKLFDLVVNGNLDSSVLPDIERISKKVVEQINSSLLSRGIIRNTNITRI